MATHQTSLDDFPASKALVVALSRVPGVRAIFLGGSRSCGCSDERSDLDIWVLNETGLADEGCVSAVRALAEHHPGRAIHRTG